MKIIRNQGDVDVKYGDLTFSKYDDFYSALDKLAKANNVDTKDMVNSFIRDLLDKVGNNDIINY